MPAIMGIIISVLHPKGVIIAVAAPVGLWRGDSRLLQVLQMEGLNAVHRGIYGGAEGKSRKMRDGFPGIRTRADKPIVIMTYNMLSIFEDPTLSARNPAVKLPYGAAVLGEVPHCRATTADAPKTRVA